MKMHSAFKIHDTVLKVSDEAKLLIPKIPCIGNENKLLCELVLCILSSQEKFEMALTAVRELQKRNIFNVPKNRSEFKGIVSKLKLLMKEPIKFVLDGKEHTRRLRFYAKKTHYITFTIENIYLNGLTIKKILREKNSALETRKRIMNYSLGLGPKQASMFLRNIGYYNGFAVLDKHVIDYMRMMGLTSLSQANFSSIVAYQKEETKLKFFAKTINVELLHLDLAIWITMRNLKFCQK